MGGVVAFLNDGFSNFENISHVHGCDDRYLSSIKQLLKFIKSFIDMGEKFFFYNRRDLSPGEYCDRLVGGNNVTLWRHIYFALAT